MNRDALRDWLITNPLTLVTVLLFGISDALLWLLPPARRHLQANARFWSRRLLGAAGIRVQANGLEKIPRGAPCVLASNHLSYADTPVWIAALPVPFRFLAKESLFRVPVIGGHLRRGGHIGVRREDPRGAARSLVEAVRQIRDHGVSILLFAEGTRARGALQDFKSGAAQLAIRAGVPVVPLAIDGTDEALPRGSFTLRPARVRVAAGEPVPTAGLTARDRDSLTARLREETARLLDSIRRDA